MTGAPHPPWLYLELAAAFLTVAAWVALPVLWLTALPLIRVVRVTATVVCLSAAASTVLPMLGRKAAPWLAVNHLLGAAAFLGFVVALGVMFRMAAARRNELAAQPDAEGAARVQDKS